MEFGIARAILLFFSAAFAGLLPQSVAAKDLLWAHVFGTESLGHQCALLTAEKIEKKTIGEYRVEVFPAKVLGGEKELRDGLFHGNVDITYSSPNSIAKFYKPISIIDAPFVFRNFSHWKAFSKSSLFEEIKEHVAAKSGQRIVAITYFGERQLAAVRPVPRLADLEGVKLRTVDADVWKALGADPVQIGFSEVYVALQSGIVDGAEMPVNLMERARYYEVLPYLSLTRHAVESKLTVVSKKAWEAMGNSDQVIVAQVLKEGADECSMKARLEEDKVMAQFAEQGMRITEVDNAELRQTIREYYLKHEGDWFNEIFSQVENVHE